MAAVINSKWACVSSQTPSSWLKLWDGPEDPLEYLRSLVRRAMGIGRWVAKSDQGSLLREPLDLSELLHPATFLNALRQQTARSAMLGERSVMSVSLL